MNIIKKAFLLTLRDVLGTIVVGFILLLPLILAVHGNYIPLFVELFIFAIVSIYQVITNIYKTYEKQVIEENNVKYLEEVKGLAKLKFDRLRKAESDIKNIINNKINIYHTFIDYGKMLRDELQVFMLRKLTEVSRQRVIHIVLEYLNKVNDYGHWYISNEIQIETEFVNNQNLNIAGKNEQTRLLMQLLGFGSKETLELFDEKPDGWISNE